MWRLPRSEQGHNPRSTLNPSYSRFFYGTRSFYKLALIKGCHRIPVAPNNIPKTVIAIIFGLWSLPVCCPD